MRIKTISILYVFFPVLYAADVPPQIREALIQFGAQQNLPYGHFSFRQDKALFEQKSGRSVLFTPPNIVFLSPGLLKHLSADLARGGDFANSPHKHKIILCMKQLLSASSPIEPRLDRALREFYSTHHLSTTFFLVGSQCASEHTRAVANPKYHTIFLSPPFQESLLQALNSRRYFTHQDQMTLLRVYGRLVQDDADQLLERYRTVIPGAIDENTKKGMAADLYAYLTCKPSILLGLLQEDAAACSRDHLAGTFGRIQLGMRTRKLERAMESAKLDRNKQANLVQQHGLCEFAEGVQAEKVRSYCLQGYTLDEIEHAWPQKPLLRRITDSF